MKLALTTSQQEAIESIDKSMLVSAGAGSGKTMVLVQRYVEILKNQPELSVHNILAVTYTRKAAKEMRTRIKARLKELYEQAKEEAGIEPRQRSNTDATRYSGAEGGVRSLDVRSESVDTRVRGEETEPRQRSDRWNKCLADMDLANIETIHSFCQSLLRAFTVEIGLNPQLDILDEIEKAQLIQDSIEETLRQIIASDNTSKVILEHYPLDTLQTFIKESLNNHLQFKQIAGNWETADRQDFIAQIDNLLTKTQKQLIADLTIDEEWHSSGSFIESNTFSQHPKVEETRLLAVQYFSQIQKSVEFFNQEKQIKESWQALLSIAQTVPLGNTGGRSDEVKEMRAAIKTLIDKSKDCSQNKKKGYGLPLNLPEDFHNDEQYWQLWKALLAVTKEAQIIYTNKKREIGKFDFDDLIGMAKAVLEAPGSAVRQYYNEKLAHILVDEFQDTNPLQAQIITMLAGDKTKLFLIGDDKQSIYKFQGADVSTFNVWQRQSENNIIFADSFRSQPNIVNFVNSIFSVLLHKEQAHVDYRAKYSPLQAQGQAAASVEIMHLPSVEESNLTEAEIEARAVANWIDKKVQEGATIQEKNGGERPINYGDFAILVPRNGDLPGFESCLGEYGIPYVTSGGKTFLDRQEIYDLENMLLFLSNPSNSHALLGVLRSPIFGISDDVIHNIATMNNAGLWQQTQDFVSKEENKRSGYQNLFGAITVLRRLLADIYTMTLSQLVYRIISDTNYDLIALTLPDGKQRYKNIWKFYTLAKDEYSAAQFAKRLELSRQLSVSEGNAAIDNKQSVKLMTIHAAKGLEFPAVALPVLSSAPRKNKSKLLFHSQYGVVLNTTRTEQERDEGVPLPYQLGKILDDDMDKAEKKRLLYVAMTRARDYLALFMLPENSKHNSAAELLLPLLENNDNGHYTILAASIDKPQNLNNSDVTTSGLGNGGLKSNSLDSNLIEQLLEPVIVYLPAQAPAPDRVSPLSHRLTPSTNHNQPSPILLGKYFHKIMQYLSKNETALSNDKLAALADQFAEEAVHPTFKQSLIEEGKKLLAIYANSPLQKLFHTAKSIQHEWSYYMSVNAEQLSINRPDLILETAEGDWYLIDYKTDRFVIADLDQQIMRHRPQLQRYGENFKQLTKIRTRLAIYFAQHGILSEF